MNLQVSTQLRIVTLPCFREKPFYVKLATFSTAQGTKNQIKAIADPKSTLKINRGHVGQFSKFCLCQQLFAFKRFCMETRLSNILKTTNATKFIKTILESTYKVVLGTYNLAATTPPFLLIRADEFYALFDIQIITFAVY